MALWVTDGTMLETARSTHQAVLHTSHNVQKLFRVVETCISRAGFPASLHVLGFNCDLRLQSMFDLRQCSVLLTRSSENICRQPQVRVDEACEHIFMRGRWVQDGGEGGGDGDGGDGDGRDGSGARLSMDAAGGGLRTGGGGGGDGGGGGGMGSPWYRYPMAVKAALVGCIIHVAVLLPGARRLNQEYRSTIGLASRTGSTSPKNLRASHQGGRCFCVLVSDASVRGGLVCHPLWSSSWHKQHD